MNKILLFLFISALSLTAVSYMNAQEQGASLIIYPQTGAFVEDSTFDVYVYLNTGGNYIDVIEVDLKFDPKVLSVVSPTKEFSIVSTWTSPPSFSNTQGIVTLRGRFQDKGISVSEGLVSIIVFRAKATGETTVSFLDSSKVILVGVEARNILNSTNIAKYDIFPSPPRGPQIFSSTHPDQNKWYKNNSPAFTFKKTRKTQGFSYSLDNDPSAEPDNIIDTPSDSCFFEGIESGVWYFHLKAKEAGIWGGASHFRINVDNIFPSAFKPQPRAFGTTLDNYLLLRFDTIDLLSGIDHYEVKIVDMSDPKNILYSAFTIVESPYRLGADRKGVFSIIIRAFDKAGNFKEGEIEIRVISPGLAIINSGILLGGTFFPFWSIISVLVIILLIVSGIIIWRVERRRNIARRLEKDIKEVEEKLENIEKLEEKTKEKSTVRQRTREAWRKVGERIRNKNIST